MSVTSPAFVASEVRKKIEGEIPLSLSVGYGDRFLFISRDQRALTHGLHKYPAKFFPELPRWIIKRYSNEGDVVLDPFVGSGTTCLEALVANRDSIGVDVDPFSRFLTHAKTTILEPAQLSRAWNSLKERINKYPEVETSADIPDFPYRDNWFKPHALRELGYIRAEIAKTRTTKEVKRFFNVCFSSIIRKVSEADDNCTRTVIRKKLNKQVLPMAAIKYFLKRADKQVENMKELHSLGLWRDVQVPEGGDAKNLSFVGDGSIDLALTSPPYLNAVDYPRTHQLEMYWLGLANGSLAPLKKKHIGTETVSAHDYRELNETGCEEADDVIAKIYEQDNRRAYIATKYLRDMFSNLTEVHRVLKYGGRYVVVVGSNLVRGQVFETWRYLSSHAPKLGYEVECVFISEIINHFIKVPRRERINDDYVLVFRKL